MPMKSVLGVIEKVNLPAPLAGLPVPNQFHKRVSRKISGKLRESLETEALPNERSTRDIERDWDLKLTHPTYPRRIW